MKKKSKRKSAEDAGAQQDGSTPVKERKSKKRTKEVTER